MKKILVLLSIVSIFSLNASAFTNSTSFDHSEEVECPGKKCCKKQKAKQCEAKGESCTKSCAKKGDDKKSCSKKSDKKTCGKSKTCSKSKAAKSE